MINYLKGQTIEVVKSANNRFILIVEVNNIGYEMQIPSRFARQISVDSQDLLQVFTHLQIREDQQVLYGFASTAERDLFRQVVSVSGIGTQLGIALIDTLGLQDLVQAIVTGNIRVLSKTPGVGKKTSERIALELKTKLAQWRQISGLSNTNAKIGPSSEVLEDVEMTMLAIGYSNEEIQQALSVLSQDTQLLKNSNAEEWIRSAIAWLS